ncbi:DUF3164 family protein [Phaeobacter sp. B1627]|uniref:DUF3164 family protein n=1 Tax=Phaeobacter sp. B1627 TaxID=2583809 RepID=UPI001118035D|nr:DUF3164 family protein [Phaeobacter sp. B1627]TNJ40474.1 DUF3164 family protein [Phaeobacter sp. B1627]
MTEQHAQQNDPSRQPAKVPSGEIEINGVSYMQNGKGDMRPTELVKPQDKLQDQTVRAIIGFAVALSEEVGRFKNHAFDDISAFEAILAEKYDAKVGGAKGNKTLISYDGRYKVQVQVSDLVDFGPELQIAKSLVDECLIEWAADARPEIRDIVTRAFNTDKAGQINRSEIFMLLRLEISDERWKRAMQAIKDAIRVVGSKSYVRCYQRPAVDAAWEPIQIDIAKA